MNDSQPLSLDDLRTAVEDARQAFAAASRAANRLRDLTGYPALPRHCFAGLPSRARHLRYFALETEPDGRPCRYTTWLKDADAWLVRLHTGAVRT